MAEVEDGGPAFPQPAAEYVDHPVHGRVLLESLGLAPAPGMSLRDWLAGQYTPSPAELRSAGWDVLGEKHGHSPKGKDFDDWWTFLPTELQRRIKARARYDYIDEQCWPHPGEIECIWIGETDSLRVGVDGVTRIERTQKGGLHCNLPYVRVWKGDALHSEHCQHALVGVVFKGGAP